MIICLKKCESEVGYGSLRREWEMSFLRLFLDISIAGTVKNDRNCVKNYIQ